MTQKTIIIIVISALLLVMGGVGAGYYFFAHNANPNTTGEVEHSVESKVPVYFNMSDPMIVNFPKGLAVHFVQMSVSFLAANEETVNSLKKHEPMVRNNLMMKINAQNPEELKTKVGKEALRKVILEEVNSILAKVAAGSRVKEVFFTAFVMQ